MTMSLPSLPDLTGATRSEPRGAEFSTMIDTYSASAQR